MVTSPPLFWNGARYLLKCSMSPNFVAPFTTIDLCMRVHVNTTVQ